MKKSIAPIVLVIFLTASFCMFSLPHVKANASEAKVLTFSWYTAPPNSVLTSSDGDLIVVGEIQNVGSNIIQNVTLTGSAFSSDGTELGTAQGEALVYQTSPGEKSPFFIDFTPSSSTTSIKNWVSSVGSVTLTVLSVTDTPFSAYSGLVINPAGGSHFNDSRGALMVDGDVENAGNQTAGYVWVVTTFYNDSGTVVSLNYTSYLCYSLAPGALVAFYSSPVDNAALQSKPTTYVLQIDSQPFFGSSSTPTPTSTNSSPFSKPGLPITLIVIIGTVVAVILIIVDLELIRKRRNNPPPPVPPPTPAS